MHMCAIASCAKSYPSTYGRRHVRRRLRRAPVPCTGADTDSNRFSLSLSLHATPDQPVTSAAAPRVLRRPDRRFEKLSPAPPVRICPGLMLQE